MFEGVSLGIAVLGADRQIRRSNPALEKFLGHSGDRLATMKFDEFTHPEDRALDLAVFQELMDGSREDYRIEKRYVRSDGRVVRGKLTVSRVPGDPNLLVAMFEDITDVVAAREEQARLLHDLGERVKELTGLHGISRVLDDHDTSVGAVLDRVVALLPPAFLVPGDTEARILCGEGVHGSSGWTDGLATLHAEFSTEDGRSGRIEVGRPLREGASREGLFLVEEQQLLETLAGMLKTFLERRAAEEHLRLVVSAGRVSLWDWDVRRKRMTWPGRLEQAISLDPRVHGMSLDEALLRVHPEDREILRGTMEEFVAEAKPGSRFTAEYRLLHPGKDDRWMLTIGELILGSDGTPERILGVSTDVTERRELEEAMRQGQKMEAIGRLAGGIAHDFNNLLTAILGFAHLAAMRIPEGNPAHKDLEQVQRAGDTATGLVKQLLAFSRRQSLRPRPVDLGALVTETGSLLERLIGGSIRIVKEIDSGVPEALADPVQLQQVLMNLAVNARDAMPEGGTLTLHVTSRRAAPPSVGEGTSARRTWAVLEVADTGCGMSPEVSRRIFEPFFTTKAAGMGTGFGLSTVYGIVHQSGGFLEVTTAPGKGSTFQVYLPLAVDPSSAPDWSTPSGSIVAR
jgi:PAS domain S-box-containing protein